MCLLIDEIIVNIEANDNGATFLIEHSKIEVKIIEMAHNLID